MLQRQKTATKAPDIKFSSAMTWEKGLFTSRDADRIPMDGLASTENVQLTQNGTIAPRPGLSLYGVQPVGTVMGQIYEYVRMNTAPTPDVPETWLIWMENRSGVGTIVTAKDGATAIVVTGKTYDITANVHFEQVYGKVIITNGVDNLSYMDVQTQTITPMTALTQPSVAPTKTVAAALVGTNINLMYVYAAANLGETAASPSVTAPVAKLRETWNGTTEYVDIVGNRITGASRYNIYVGDQVGSLYFLDSIADPGSGATFTYRDTGTIAETTTRIAPVGDSTAGPKTTRATNIKGQVYMTGDTDNPGRIWFGGNGESALDFSSYNGGGWTEPNKGGKDFPVKIIAFRDGKGTPMATCLSKGTNGAGKRYLLSPSTTTVGTTVISYMAVQEDNGQDGTDSPDGVVVVNDSIFYPSRTGFKTTSTKPQIQNLLSTQGITDNISTDVTSLSSRYMESCVGIANDQRIYWALPYSDTVNNQIWVLDLRQKGAWVRPWYVPAKWLTLYADNTDGMTRMLALVNNQICVVDSNAATSDNGTAFATNASSGDIKFNEDGTMWGSVIDVTFIFLRPQGNINLSVNAVTEDGLLTFSDTMASSATQAIGAHGRYGWGGTGWGGLSSDFISVSTSEPKKKWTIPIDEECKSLSWSLGTQDIGVNYQLAEVVVRYVPIGFREEDN
jgi:hypothetical protein